MIDTLRAKSKAEDKAGSVSRRSQPQSRNRSQSRSQSRSQFSHDDRADAENYYRLWARSLQAKLDDAQRSKTAEKPNRVVDRDRDHKRPTPRRP